MAHFFDQDKPHGLVKRIMLKKFLEGFIASTLSETHSERRALFIDGFAGTGLYGEDWPDRTEMFGSPLIALRVALEHFKKFPSHEPTLESKVFLYFIEKKEKFFKKLKENLKRTLREYGQRVNELEGTDNTREYSFTCRNASPVFCKTVKCDFKMFEPPTEIRHRNVRCATFLDPFGLSDTPMDVVRKFCGAPNLSLIINFMSSYVAKFGDINRENVKKTYGINILEEMLRQKHPELNTDLDLLTFYIDWVLGDVLQQSGTNIPCMPEEQVLKCTRFYEKLLRYFTGSEYVVTFGMRREKEDTFIYHILFTTSDIQSLEHMKEAMNRVSNYQHKLEMGNYDLVIGGVVLDLANSQDSNAVAGTIFDKFRGRCKIPIRDIKSYVLADTPYVFRKEPLKIMCQESNPRIVEVVDKGHKSPTRRGTFPDHTAWYITFSNGDRPISPVRRAHRKLRYQPYPVPHVPLHQRPSTSQYQ